MHCPECQHENPDGARFCNGCGQPLALSCLACGHTNPPQSRFCNTCGQALALSPPPTDLRKTTPRSYTPKHLADKILASRAALEGERKQVTVLFADVVGFSTLAERLDPEIIHTLMDGCFEILTREVHAYEGTINQFTGDGIMALFGAPITHEDHALRALHAALGIQEALKGYSDTVQRRWGAPFQMRIGLNTGLVVVAGIGDNLRMDYTAQGDTTNLAARLQQLAPAGEIWVGETTYRLTKEAFEWRTIGPLAIKGKAEPVPVYDLLGRRVVKSRFEVVAQRGLTPLVGRDPDLQKLLAAWEKVKQGQGQVVSVVGEAGIGKSRLLYEFKQHVVEECRGNPLWLPRAGTEACPYVEGSCFAYGDIIPYLPFLEIVKEVFGLEGIGSEPDAKRQIRERLAMLHLEPSAVEPYLHNLLALMVENDLFPKLTPQVIRQRTVEALKTLVLAEATCHPLVLILEDVHWIDKATEEVLAALVEAMAAVPLLLVLVYRPEYVHAWVEKAYQTQIALTRLPSASSAVMVRAILTKPYATRVPLERLSPEQSKVMVQELLGMATLPPELESLIVTKTEGNPFFVEELTRSLLESGTLVRQNGGYVLTKPLEALDLPTTVQGVLLARIDRLTEDLKEVLQIASVIGRVFSVPVLAHVVERGPALEDLLVQLEDLEFIYPTSLYPSREYSFKHVLTQEAVYHTLLRPKREAYHERIGQALEALYPDRLEEYYELLAYHYSRSANTDKAVDYLDLANQKAAKANAMDEAKRYFDEAMKLLDTLPETEGNHRRRIFLLVNQGMVMLLLLKSQECYDLLTRYEPMAVRLGDPGLLGAFYARLGQCEWAFGSFDQAIQTETKAAELCEVAGNAEDAGLAYNVLQWSHLYKGDYDQVFTLKEQVLRTSERRFNLQWYTKALAAASLAYSQLGRWDDAVEEAQKALRVGEEYSDSSVMSFAAWNVSWAYTSKGDLGRALEYGELAVQKAPTPGDKAWAQAALAWAWCRAGEPHRGVEILAAQVPMYRAVRFRPAEIFTPFLGDGYWLAGEFDKATQTLEEYLDLTKRCGMKFHLGFAHRLLGEIALSSNPAQVEPPLAAPHFERSIAILREIKAENELALAYAGYGRLHKQQGNIAQAREYLTQALEIFERLGTLIEPDKVRHALAELPEREV